jgi:hypothetical protein
MKLLRFQKTTIAFGHLLNTLSLGTHDDRGFFSLSSARANARGGGGGGGNGALLLQKRRKRSAYVSLLCRLRWLRKA